MIDKQAAEQLIVLFDDLYNEYHSRVSKMRNTIGASEFPEVNRKKYKMISIPKSIWQLLIQFSNDHDHLEGDSNWHMFNPVGGTDKIYVQRNLESRRNAGIQMAQELG